MPDQRDVQQLIQSLTPSAVNNGNPNTVYNQPQPQGGYIPPTFDPGTNTWRINPAPAPSNINWQQMSASQPQSWGWQGPAQPAPPVIPGGPGPTTPAGPTTPVPAPNTNNLPPYTPGVVNQPKQVGDMGVGSQDEVHACVVIDSFLSDYDRADDVRVGDEMFVIDPISYRKSVGRVQYSETKIMPCVRIMTESGITLDCSTTAPIADQFGEQILAPDLLNKLVPVCDNGVFYLDRVTSIEELGDLEVQHITVEDNYFLAGKEKGKYLFHHNIKMDGAQRYDLYGMSDRLGETFGWSNNTGGMGAESMGSTPNTRGAMQANGTWDIAHGGTVSNPATVWGQAQQAPVGQGIVDAFGNPVSDITDNSGYMSEEWEGLGNPNIDSWDTSWMQPASGTGAIPTLPAVQAQAEGGQGFWGNLWDTVKGGLLTAADAIIPGNLYHSDTGEVAPWQAWVTSAADGALGLGGIGQQAWDAYGKGALRDGYNDTSSAERTAIGNLQYQYQQASPQKQAQMLQSMTKPGSGYPQAVIDAITGGESYWQGTR